MARRLFRRGMDSAGVTDAPDGRAVWEVRRGPLMLHALLTLLAVGFALQVAVPLPPALADQWPLLLIIGGGALLLFGLVTARAAGALLGPVLVALGLVATLAEQEMLASGPGLAGGALLLAVALAVMLRGVSFARP